MGMEVIDTNITVEEEPTPSMLMHEKLIHELEEERHLRLQSEKRLQEVTLESERSRMQMRGLQQQFSRYCSVLSILLQEVQ
ncbi:hypothetical protein CB1_000966006 [Camelus ferus]|nr:hypothetical protein CB1_000966006 [Camelus ferus]